MRGALQGLVARGSPTEKSPERPGRRDGQCSGVSSGVAGAGAHLASDRSPSRAEASRLALEVRAPPGPVAAPGAHGHRLDRNWEGFGPRPARTKQPAIDSSRCAAAQLPAPVHAPCHKFRGRVSVPAGAWALHFAPAAAAATATAPPLVAPPPLVSMPPLAARMPFGQLIAHVRTSSLATCSGHTITGRL